MDRSSQVHARCHRDFKKSSADYMFADITAIMVYYSSFGIKPFGSHPWLALNHRGKIRGLKIETRNLKWYNEKSWHPGFDLAGTAGAGSSEDSFTWHDGALTKHLCHQSGGDTVWMVRGGATIGTVDAPGMSCNHILHANPKTKGRSGPYYIKLQSKPKPKRVYCDMATHGGGWTMWNKLNRGQQVYSWATNHAVDSHAYSSMNQAGSFTGAASNYKMRGDDINAIRASHQTWGAKFGYSPNAAAMSYWTMTPGSGTGAYGAENFHRQDCDYAAKQSSSSLKNTKCHWNRWEYTGQVGQQVNWWSGGHWWDNSGCYNSWSSHANEGNHGTGSKCYTNGRGLGYHCGGYSPFHRGWCGSASWGLEFVR